MECIIQILVTAVAEIVLCLSKDGEFTDLFDILRSKERPIDRYPFQPLSVSLGQYIKRTRLKMENI
jgi:hypothetical protein